MSPHDHPHVWRLWAVVVVLSLLEAVVFKLLHHTNIRDITRGPRAAVYVAANVFAFFAALLLLVHFFGRRWLPYSAPPSPRAELTHLFVHLLCLAYLRTACWFEGRSVMRWLLAL